MGIEVSEGNELPPRVLKKANGHTRPAPARQDVPFLGQGRNKQGGEEVQTTLPLSRSPRSYVSG